MAHYCEAALITCEDFRLHQRKDGRNYIAEFIKNIGTDCDLITRAGGIQDIVRPKDKSYCDCLLRDSGVSAKLHNAKTVYIINHADCGAYGGFNFQAGEKEFARHKKDMIKAKSEILKEFPELSIKLYYGELATGSNDIFNIKKIN